jgi:hypothetical protein
LLLLLPTTDPGLLMAAAAGLLLLLFDGTEPTVPVPATTVLMAEDNKPCWQDKMRSLTVCTAAALAECTKGHVPWKAVST